MAKALAGAVFGAGSVTAFNNSDLKGIIGTIMNSSNSWSTGAAPSSSGPSQRDVDHLTRMVEQLTRDMNSRGSVTIVSGQNSRGQSYFVITCGGMAAVYLAYLRLVKGYQLGDLLYVTHGSLKKSVGQVSERLEGLQKYLNSVKEYVTQQVNALVAKQDESLAAQKRMEDQISVVGSDVEDTRTQVVEMHAAVRELENNIEGISNGQQYANEGIYILCRVVGEMMKGSGQRLNGVLELEKYVKKPPALGTRPNVAGLEGLLQEGADDSRLGGRIPALPASGGIVRPRPALLATDFSRSASAPLRDSHALPSASGTVLTGIMEHDLDSISTNQSMNGHHTRARVH